MEYKNTHKTITFEFDDDETETVLTITENDNDSSNNNEWCFYGNDAIKKFKKVVKMI